MIIKSMSRKEPSFRQLIEYIDRDLNSEHFCIRHNLMGRNHKNILQEFEENAHLLRKRKNGVFLYHEIISISRAKGLTAREQQELLLEIVQNYISARCPDNLVYGGLHQDKDHSYHFHLMISANRAGDEKRLRLSKAQFREIQVKLEAHVLEKYPELEQKVSMDKRAEHKQARGAVEHQRRTGRYPSRHEGLRGRVQSAYNESRTSEGLIEALSRKGFRLESRGKIIARVVDEYTNKTHRVKTLDPDLAVLIEARLAEPQMKREAEPEEKAQTAQEEEIRDQVEPEAQTESTSPEAEPENVQEPPEAEELHPEVNRTEERDFLKEMQERREAQADRKRQKALRKMKRKGKPR